MNTDNKTIREQAIEWAESLSPYKWALLVRKHNLSPYYNEDLAEQAYILEHPQQTVKEDSVVSLEQMAVNYASNRDNGAGFGYPSFTADLIEKGFIAGAKQREEQYKELLSSYRELLEVANVAKGFLTDGSPTYDLLENQIQRASKILNNLK